MGFTRTALRQVGSAQRSGQGRCGCRRQFARKRPISWHYGYDRGTPIDRYYIESFLERRVADVRGRVLEIGDDSYSRRFGSGVTRQDVLHIDPRAPGATITGDLSQTGLLPDQAFDCMIVTQTLHLIYDVAAAVGELHRGLKPGGALLVTLPGVASVDRGEFADTWYWSMTAKSVERLFGDVFGPANIAVGVHGNVYAATCFLHGLALEEINQGWLDNFDPSYPMIVTVRARRADWRPLGLRIKREFTRRRLAATLNRADKHR